MGILSWFTRRRLDEKDLEAEIRAHLAIAREERVADGADPRDAQYEALREFGNVTLTTEAVRGVWTPRWLESLRGCAADVRYAMRARARNPAFSLTVVGVLTLGIGLNAAVFTMLKAVLLSPVAGVEGSARLAVIFGETRAGRPVRVSYPDYQYLRDHDRAFSGLFGTAVARVNIGRGRAARQVWGELVTGNYFQLLGVRAQSGRPLLPSDETAPGRQPVVVLSDGLWRKQFGADPAIVGRTLEINNHGSWRLPRRRRPALPLGRAEARRSRGGAWHHRRACGHQAARERAVRRQRARRHLVRACARVRCRRRRDRNNPSRVARGTDQSAAGASPSVE